MLIERILDAKPSIFQIRPNEIFHVDGALKVFPRDGLLDPGGHSDVWALVDSNTNLYSPDPVFTNIHTSFFVVQATSPQAGRWKSWRKELSAEVMVMKPWSWEEIYIAGSVLSLRHILILIFVFHRTQLCITELKGDLRLIFRRYGRSARHCFDLAQRVSGAEGFERGLSAQFRRIPDLHQMELDLRDGSHIFELRDGMDGQSDGQNGNREIIRTLKEVPSQIITVVPGDDRQPVLTFVTRHIANRFYEEILAEDARKFWLYYNQFSSQPQSRGSAGWLWNNHVLRELKSGDQKIFPLAPLISSSQQPPPKKLRTDSLSITVPFDGIVVYGGVESLAQALSQNSLSGRATLFIPGASNEATFDAFLISKNNIFLLQFTIQPHGHDVKAKGLDFIWDSVNAAMELLKEDTSRSNALSKLLPNHGSNWRLIFVIPASVSGSWKHSQNINFGGKNPKRAWNNYLEQCVMVLEDKKPGTHIFIFNVFSSHIFPL